MHRAGCRTVLHEHIFGAFFIIVVYFRREARLQPVSSVRSVSDSQREAEYLCGLWLRPSVLRYLPLAVKSALGDVRRAARPMSPLPPHTPRTALPAHCGTYLYVTLTVSSRRRTR